MSDTVYANGNAIACKAGDVKVIAAFPDVCKSPPGPPTGPMPVPYAASSFARDLHAGSKSVKIGGQPIALKNQSYFKSSPLGNEAATKSFGAGIASQQMGGKTYFAMWSMNVRIEGANVCRHTDIATSNHGSNSNTPTQTALSKASPPPNATEAQEGPTCECCDGPMHAGQKEGEQPGPVVSEENWYMAGPEEAAYIDDLLEDLRKAWPPAANKTARKRAEAALDTLAELDSKMIERREMLALGRALGCPSLPEPPCNVYRVLPAGAATEIDNEWLEKGQEHYLKDRGYPKGSTTHHRVPKAAGGCPGSTKADGNLVHDSVLSADCREFESILQGMQTKVCQTRDKRNKRGRR